MLFHLIVFSLASLAAALPVTNNLTNVVTTSSVTISLNSSTTPTITASVPALTTTSSDTTEQPLRYCQINASTYQHREQIPRPDPCELCVCVDSEMYCLWRLCPVPESTTATSTHPNNTQVMEKEFTQLITQQREFNAIKEKERSLQTTTIPTSTDPTSCYVMGVHYQMGEVLPRDTGTCLECSCAEGARVTCTPKDCASQPDLDYLQHSNSLDMFDLDTF